MMFNNAQTIEEGNNIVDPETLKFRRACKDFQQAAAVIQKVENDNRLRVDKQAAILRRFNDAQPWDQKKLEASGQGWRQNFSTGFLSTMIMRAAPGYKQIIDNAKTLTSSTLSNETVDGQQKSILFQEQITKTIRKWNQFNDFISRLVIERCLMGAATPCFMDEWDWHPTLFNSDDILFPDGTPDHEDGVSYFVVKQQFQIHELADLLIDPETSATAGWHIENVITAINNAKPEDRRSDTNDKRKIEEVIRESNMSSSVTDGVKIIDARHLYIREHGSGKVSHWIVENKTNKGLFARIEQYESMAEVVVLMTLEIGDGKLYGSKGFGRMLYNIAVGKEQAMMLQLDNLYLGGLLLLKRENGKAKNEVAISVAHPVCVVGESFSVVPEQIPVNTEAFFALDRAITSLAEMRVGTFIPSQVSPETGEKRTATEVSYVSSVEQSLKDAQLRRQWQQFQRLVYQMQRRICSEDNIMKAQELLEQEMAGTTKMIAQKFFNFLKTVGRLMVGHTVKPMIVNEDAVKCCMSLMRDGLTPEEIFELGQCPPQDMGDDTVEKEAAMEQIAAQYIGHPMINQQELIGRNLSYKLGPTIAKKLLIPDGDQTIKNEAVRQQLLEIPALMAGEEIPVSPRDDDLLHLQVLMGKLPEVAQALKMQPVPQPILKAVNMAVKHAKEHLIQGKQKNVSEDALVQMASILAEIEKAVSAATAASNAAINAQGMPQPPPGNPAVNMLDQIASTGAPATPAMAQQPNMTRAERTAQNSPMN